MVNNPEEEPLLYVIKYPFELASIGKKIFIPVPKINILYLKNRLLNRTKHKRKRK